MNRSPFFVAALGLQLALAGAALRAQAAPLFLNGVVVKADSAGARITIERAGQKAMTLPVEGDARLVLPSLSKGDRVILGGRESADGRTLSAVTEIRKGQETTGSRAVVPLGGIEPAAPTSAGSPPETPPIRREPQPPIVVVETSPSLPAAPPGAVPLEVVTNPIPSVPKAAPKVEIIVPRPVVSSELESTSDVGSGRAARDFDRAVSVLAFKARDLDRLWAAYTEQCSVAPTSTSDEPRGWPRILRGNEPSPADDGCRGSLAEVADLAGRFQHELDAIAETARRAGVLPGRLRTSLARESLDSLL